MTLRTRSQLKKLSPKDLEAYLEGLTRQELQSLAKREGLRASGKSVVIVGRLVKQIAKVDVPTPPKASKKPVPDASNLTKEDKRELMSPSCPPSPPRASNIESAPAQPDALPATEATEPPRAPNRRPSCREVRELRRRLANHTNTDDELHRGVSDCEIILAKVLSAVDEAENELKETIYTRSAIEHSYLRIWDINPSFWDGSRVYPPGPDKEKWDAWSKMREIEEEKESEREDMRIQQNIKKYQAILLRQEEQEREWRREMAAAKSERETQLAAREGAEQPEISNEAGPSNPRKRTHRQIDA